MKISLKRGALFALTVLAGFALTGCSRLLPPRKGEAHSYQLVLDTRRFPVETLSGCFVPEIYPAISKIPIVYAQKVPPNAVFTSATVEVLASSGEMKVLETVIEDNQVYLKFAVPTPESSSQYNVLVRVKYEYRR
ncbi:MAG TPA: hypothetical protein VG838_11985 [Opitutaceae bacterium]|nr:hypothetical protein [Opitutaceae bacterium]